MRNCLRLSLLLATVWALCGCMTQEQQRCHVLWQNVAGVEGRVTGEPGSKAPYAYAAFPVDKTWHAIGLAPPEMPDTVLLLTYRADQQATCRTVDDRLRAWIAHEDQTGSNSGLVQGPRLGRWQALLALARAGQTGEPLCGHAEIQSGDAEHISVQLDLATLSGGTRPGRVTGEVWIEHKTTSPVLEGAMIALAAPAACAGVIILVPVLIIAHEAHRD